MITTTTTQQPPPPQQQQQQHQQPTPPITATTSPNTKRKKLKSTKPSRSIVRPFSETEREEQGIIRLDVFSTFLRNPKRLLAVTTNDNVVGETLRKSTTTTTQQKHQKKVMMISGKDACKTPPPFYRSSSSTLKSGGGGGAGVKAEDDLILDVEGDGGEVCCNDSPLVSKVGNNNSGGGGGWKGEDGNDTECMELLGEDGRDASAVTSIAATTTTTTTINGGRKTYLEIVRSKVPLVSFGTAAAIAAVTRFKRMSSAGGDDSEGFQDSLSSSASSSSLSSSSYSSSLSSVSSWSNSQSCSTMSLWISDLMELDSGDSDSEFEGPKGKFGGCPEGDGEGNSDIDVGKDVGIFEEGEDDNKYFERYLKRFEAVRLASAAPKSGFWRSACSSDVVREMKRRRMALGEDEKEEEEERVAKERDGVVGRLENGEFNDERERVGSLYPPAKRQRVEADTSESDDGSSASDDVVIESGYVQPMFGRTEEFMGAGSLATSTVHSSPRLQQTLRPILAVAPPSVQVQVESTRQQQQQHREQQQLQQPKRHPYQPKIRPEPQVQTQVQQQVQQQQVQQVQVQQQQQLQQRQSQQQHVHQQHQQQEIVGAVQTTEAKACTMEPPVNNHTGVTAAINMNAVRPPLGFAPTAMPSLPSVSALVNGDPPGPGSVKVVVPPPLSTLVVAPPNPGNTVARNGTLSPATPTAIVPLSVQASIQQAQAQAQAQAQVQTQSQAQALADPEAEAKAEAEAKEAQAQLQRRQLLESVMAAGIDVGSELLAIATGNGKMPSTVKKTGDYSRYGISPSTKPGGLVSASRPPLISMGSDSGDLSWSYARPVAQILPKQPTAVRPRMETRNAGFVSSSAPGNIDPRVRIGAIGGMVGFVPSAMRDNTSINADHDSMNSRVKMGGVVPERSYSASSSSSATSSVGAYGVNVPGNFMTRSMSEVSGGSEPPRGRERFQSQGPASQQFYHQQQVHQQQQLQQQHHHHHQRASTGRASSGYNGGKKQASFASSGSEKEKSGPSLHSKTGGKGEPKTRAAPTKATKPLPDFLGGGRMIKDRKGNMIAVEMGMFSECAPNSPVMVWKGQPLVIPENAPRRNECNPQEIATCETLRIMPSQYLEIKETLLATVVVRGPYKKRDAQGWFRIDVNKTNKLYDWFVAVGWIDIATAEWEKKVRAGLAE
ncbi:Transcriptional adapter ada2 [Blyttiomyces sp. JEL0837]|nr:Transcriptional adapter ada2 [Blyttiomyces sp. JEL0837]